VRQYCTGTLLIGALPLLDSRASLPPVLSECVSLMLLLLDPLSLSPAAAAAALPTLRHLLAAWRRDLLPAVLTPALLLAAWLQPLLFASLLPPVLLHRIAVARLALSSAQPPVSSGSESTV